MLSTKGIGVGSCRAKKEMGMRGRKGSEGRGNGRRGEEGGIPAIAT